MKEIVALCKRFLDGEINEDRFRSDLVRLIDEYDVEVEIAELIKNCA